MEIKILYEDENVLVLDKPAGLSVHGDGRTTEKTLADWLIEKYPALAAVGEPLVGKDGQEIPKPGIVHRLDKDTTGVLLVAKNQPVYLSLKKQFKNHTIKKIYHLLVQGRFPHRAMKETGTIDLPIGRSPHDSRKRLAGGQAAGLKREALTYYRPLENFPDFAYVEAHPLTGRTHQLRAHFSAIGHPVVSDTLYGFSSPRTIELGMARQALHAYSLTFKVLGGGEKTVVSPEPADFRATLDKIRSLC